MSYLIANEDVDFGLFKLIDHQRHPRIMHEVNIRKPARSRYPHSSLSIVDASRATTLIEAIFLVRCRPLMPVCPMSAQGSHLGCFTPVEFAVLSVPVTVLRAWGNRHCATAGKLIDHNAADFTGPERACQSGSGDDGMYT